RRRFLRHEVDVVGAGWHGERSRNAHHAIGSCSRCSTTRRNRRGRRRCRRLTSRCSCRRCRSLRRRLHRNRHEGDTFVRVSLLLVFVFLVVFLLSGGSGGFGRVVLSNVALVQNKRNFLWG